MIKIEYKVGGNVIETFYEPNMAFAVWLVNRLKRTTHTMGKFKISKV
jgi:translation initiation factor IF-1